MIVDTLQQLDISFPLEKLKKIKCKPRILYTVKLSFKY